MPSATIYADEIAFFYALEADFKALKQDAQLIGTPIKIGKQEIQRLEIAGHRLYAAKMGSGPVTTAISTATLLSRFRCDFALSIGPVGALADDLPVGSWRMVHSYTAYQKGTWNQMGFQLAKLDDASGFDATRAKEVRGRLKIPTLLTGPDGISVASGEIFIASSAYRVQLRSASGAQAVDMNLSGIEAACTNLDVPLVSWRVISDRADDTASENFRTFVEHYDGAGGRAISEMIRNLPANPNSPEAYPELKKTSRSACHFFKPLSAMSLSTG